jgi:hypothetical protein
MRWGLLKRPSFWVGLAIAVGAIVIAVAKLDTDPHWKIVIIGAMGVLYLLSQYFNVSYLSKADAKEQVQMRLECVNSLKHLDPTQNLRANIFIFSKKSNSYHIIHQYNMQTDSDKDVELPKGEGCTGRAWTSRTQVWGDKGQILRSGDHRVPENQVSKIRPDLEWVCSTPIFDTKRREVVAVINFDGNKPMDPKQQQVVMEHANRLAHELACVYARIGKFV